MFESNYLHLVDELVQYTCTAFQWMANQNSCMDPRQETVKVKLVITDYFLLTHINV